MGPGWRLVLIALQTLHDGDRELRMRLASARTLVVKLGSNVVVDEQGRFAENRCAAVLDVLKKYLAADCQWVIVSSGAVARGMNELGIHHLKATGSNRLACAATGQGMLWTEWNRILNRLHRIPAQILLTEADFSDRDRYLQTAELLQRLLHLGATPIINENDSASGKTRHSAGEVFDDNDRLAALIAAALDASALLLLTNVDGVFDKPPHQADAKLMSVFRPSAVVDMAGTSSLGRGGMRAKVSAAQFAARSGVPTLIANGTKPDQLAGICRGEPGGTLFLPAVHTNKRRRWITYATVPQGKVTINQGALDALRHRGSSLLLSGVTQIDGDFAANSVICIDNADGLTVGRGICRQSSSQARSAQETSTGSQTIIKRDDLVLFHEEDL